MHKPIESIICVLIIVIVVSLSYFCAPFIFDLFSNNPTPAAPSITDIKVRDQEKNDLRNELSWYKEQSKRILGDGFKPGNVMSTTINLSSYNPVEEQCDDTPLVASDNGLVTPGIIALPQDYRKDLGLDFGQIVWIPPYGQFIVRDHMHDRKKSGRGDIISFIPDWSKKFGINNMATMYWFMETMNSSD
jgi:hypothetical protein